jgi:serine acetyltransferase
VILSGVKISTGVIVGAGSVVTKDLPPYAVAVGNPARIVRYRFEESVINLLLESKWWDRDIEELRNINFRDVNSAIEILGPATLF